jgi:predicted nucleic acid-binding protein
MAILLDTNILGRLANTSDAAHSVAKLALASLHSRGETLNITAQVLIEFRNFATRPIPNNGLGLSAAEASQLVSQFEATFPLLPEMPAIYPAWRAIVDGLGVIGKTVHDARLVAVCHVHGVSHILTFNASQFTTLAKFGPGVVVLNPHFI